MNLESYATKLLFMQTDVYITLHRNIARLLSQFQGMKLYFKTHISMFPANHQKKTCEFISQYCACDSYMPIRNCSTEQKFNMSAT